MQPQITSVILETSLKQFVCITLCICNVKYQLFIFSQAQFMDVICVNRYYGWYHSSGHPETIQESLSYELNQWYNMHKKPIIMTEYGASSVAGIHEVK